MESKAQGLAGIVLTGAATIFFYLSVLSLDYERTPFFDLSPSPDGSEYMAGAVSLYRDGSHHVHFAGKQYPSRYPPGFSLLMVPFLAIGFEPVSVPFRANQTLATAMLLLVGLWAWRRKGPLSAGLTLLILATLPGFVALIRSPMSEIAGGFFVLASFLCFDSYLRKQRLIQGLTAALLLGFACSIHLSQFFFAPVLLCVSLLAGNWGASIRKLGLFAAAFLVGALPVLVQGFSRSGNPLSTGYGQWLDTSRLFSTSYVWMNVGKTWSEMLESETGFSTVHIYGTGSYFGLSLVLLALFSSFLQVRKRGFSVFFIPSAVFAAALLSYRYMNGRLIWPLLLLAAVLVGYSATSLLGLQGARRKPWLRAVVALLLVGQILGLPGRRSPLELTTLLDHESLYGKAHRYSSVEALKVAAADENPTVFSEIPPSYVAALSPTPMRVHPVRDAHYPGTGNLDRLSRETVLYGALKENRPVYLLTGRLPLEIAARYLPPPRGYIWKSVHLNERRGGVAKATRGRPDAASIGDESRLDHPQWSVGWPPDIDSPPPILRFSPYLLDGTGSRGGVFTRLEFLNTALRGRIFLEILDPDGAAMPLKTDAGPPSSRLSADLSRGEVISLETSAADGLRPGYVRVLSDPGIEGVAVLGRFEPTPLRINWREFLPLTEGLTKATIPLFDTASRDLHLTLVEASNAGLVGNVSHEVALAFRHEAEAHSGMGKILMDRASQVTRSLASLVGMTGSAVTGFLDLESSSPIGLAVWLGHPDPEQGPALSGVLTPLPPAETAGLPLCLPYIADGTLDEVQFQTSLVLDASQAPARVTVEFYDEAGRPLELEVSGAGRAARHSIVLRQGRQRFLSTPGTGRVRSGYALLKADRALQLAATLTARDTAGKLLFRAPVPVLHPTITDFSFFADTVGRTDTQILLVNPAVGETGQEPQKAQVVVRAYNRGFRILWSEALDVPTSTQLNLSLERLIRRFEEMDGLLTVQSDRPLAAVISRQTTVFFADPAGAIPVPSFLPVVPVRPDRVEPQ